MDAALLELEAIRLPILVGATPHAYQRGFLATSPELLRHPKHIALDCPGTWLEHDHIPASLQDPGTAASSMGWIIEMERQQLSGDASRRQPQRDRPDRP